MKPDTVSWLCALAATCTVLFPHALHASDPTPCDLLAAHPADPDARAPGQRMADIDVAEAQRQCRTAVEAQADEPRGHYQLARVLYYQDGDLDEVVQHLRIAVAHGYRQAIFVLGYLHAVDERLGPDHCRAGRLWQRAAAWGHPWAHFHLVEKALDGSFAGCNLEFSHAELAALMQAATGLISSDSSDGRVEALYRRYLLHIEAPGLVRPVAPTRCDALAAHGFDSGRAAPGVSTAQMNDDLVSAINACAAAVTEAPGNARLHYQLARALYYDGRVAEAMPHLEISSELGWAQGTFVLGYIYSGDDGSFPPRPCRAAGLYRASLDHDHFWSKVFLARQWLDGELAGCTITLDEAAIRRMLRSAEVQAQIDPSYAEGVAEVSALLSRVDD